MIYMGPSVIGNNNPVTLEAIPVPSELVTGDTLPITYYSTAAGGLVTAPITLVERMNSGIAQREVIKSQAAASQSYWLQDPSRDPCRLAS